MVVYVKLLEDSLKDLPAASAVTCLIMHWFVLSIEIYLNNNTLRIIAVGTWQNVRKRGLNTFARLLSFSNGCVTWVCLTAVVSDLNFLTYIFFPEIVDYQPCSGGQIRLKMWGPWSPRYTGQLSKAHSIHMCSWRLLAVVKLQAQRTRKLLWTAAIPPDIFNLCVAPYIMCIEAECALHVLQILFNLAKIIGVSVIQFPRYVRGCCWRSIDAWHRFISLN